MNAFRFTLQRILELRTRIERARASDLGASRTVQQQRHEAVRDAQARLARCGEQIVGASETAVPAGTLQALGLTRHAASEALAAADRSLEKASHELAHDTARFGQARMERRVVERLRERRQGAWNVEASRSEQADSDDVARRTPGSENLPS